MSNACKQVSVWCGGAISPELRFSMDLASESQMNIRFEDSVLPADERAFISFQCPIFLLEEAAAGLACRLVAEEGVCVMLTDGGPMLTLLHQRQDFPFANTWQVDRLEFCLAVQSLSWTA